MKDKVFSTKYTLNIRGKVLDMSSPKVMGIINVTPDSFYAKSRKTGIKEIAKAASNMISQGATFLDIGGYSSRPGAVDISIEEELNRVIPAICEILDNHPEALLSIDTFRTKVADEAIKNGVILVNDITGGEGDPEMKHLIAEKKVPYVLMHMRGTPRTMNTLVDYKDMVIEIMDYFVERVEILRNLMVTDIIVDPGFGFSKTVSQNYVLLRNLAYFKALELPILVGLSRKSMVYKSLDIHPDEALNGTTVLNTIALTNGAGILRVHDVKEAIEAVNLFEKVYS